MKKTVFLFLSLFILVSAAKVFSQGTIYDDFSKKDMPGWIWGGLEMKYSHETDNKENGFADLYTTNTVKAKSLIGKITKSNPFLFSAGNYINVMFKGVSNDVTVKFILQYDIDNNGKYNEDKDILLISKPLSMNFSGWKEIKVKLDQENFKLISKFDDDFSVTEEEALAMQFEFDAGKDYKESKFESGIALISEIISKDNLNDFAKDDKETKEAESYFDAKNYPNPFNPVTTISYTLKENASVRLTVYDRLGREVKVLIDENQGAGTHTVEFNASNLPSGIYFYRIKANDRTEVKKMILAK
ncbi:MAG: T9SS type A sorting domain-containing protein [Ignavibacteriae bacterium]|nr:T9SS type A sorting domain-containing protein [Ignavibacteriota bacterium]